ncbi:hypothetical protein J6590_016279 [Homalodisca vitripennis]|uniref:Uncharacterized protein n=1 Tax=Homalodisca liturata TaxID=320908 RepID=A0A1B6HB61_9HEMI|nr:hypothetical protein J6590_016279 [Homalodisca vitripennis]
MKLIVGLMCSVLPIIAWHDGNHLIRMDRNIKHLITNPTKQRSLLVLGYMDSFVELFEYVIEKMTGFRDSAKEAAEYFVQKRPDGPKFARLPINVYENCEKVFEFNNETSAKFTNLIELTNTLWPKFVKEYQIIRGVETNKSEEEIIFGPGP